MIENGLDDADSVTMKVLITHFGFQNGVDDKKLPEYYLDDVLS